VDHGAAHVIIGTAAFSERGPNYEFLERLSAELRPERIALALDSKEGKIVVKGWQESTSLSAVDLIADLAPYCSAFLCTYVDKEGMMQGTDIEWFRSLRQATDRSITAAGGITTMSDVEALTSFGIDCAIGMSIYTGRLSLDDLRRFNLASR
jgi:phosphoribosylformimino-5-aminoimidazole carboxamide ribonucleotide (ProFAR) isomerase